MNKKYLIWDVPNISISWSEWFEMEFGVTILDPLEMTRKILLWKGWGNCGSWSTLVVFPGCGATLVKFYIETLNADWTSQWLWKAHPFAKRFWNPGQNPVALVGRVSRGVIVGIKDVVVIDDVISSGETIRKCRKENLMFIPGARWHALSWVGQKAAITKGFVGTFSSVVVGEIGTKVPINSLSTLIEKKDIAGSYAKRNLGNQEKAFLELLEDFRKGKWDRIDIYCV
ncbi:MAG: Uncharacterized protein G01um101418_978 [Parcubacteria group bacterium Gr01-1014_18]|nr:MAG: Uncharacterized protein Greene041636_987 [Parcubacteria group bacterium Greene0416_36]TSC79419.1 MAG: Uncharacterized protein G01um101418_978 [Parcubacteria group bacterium Gr01-1014_18]TSC97807.1 MAG: Uncharacterized protein Greene101420_994 [Parcubacteria group bacterium Greene1014_20]TSD06017.1 MAG: Uncharacterized protein Greene07142_965 [Parcubacteria group bacterium Greene0714_2]